MGTISNSLEVLNPVGTHVQNKHDLKGLVQYFVNVVGLTIFYSRLLQMSNILQTKPSTAL